MTRRSRGREVALQVLYQVEQNPGVPAEEVSGFIKRRLLGDRKLCDFTDGLITGVKEHQAKIDAMISQVAENWRLDRMAAIDRNIFASVRMRCYSALRFPPRSPSTRRSSLPSGIAPLNQADLSMASSTVCSSGMLKIRKANRARTRRLVLGPKCPRLSRVPMRFTGSDLLSPSHRRGIELAFEFHLILLSAIVPRTQNGDLKLA